MGFQPKFVPVQFVRRISVISLGLLQQLQYDHYEVAISYYKGAIIITVRAADTLDPTYRELGNSWCMREEE